MVPYYSMQPCFQGSSIFCGRRSGTREPVGVLLLTSNHSMIPVIPVIPRHCTVMPEHSSLPVFDLFQSGGDGVISKSSSDLLIIFSVHQSTERSSRTTWQTSFVPPSRPEKSTQVAITPSHATLVKASLSLQSWYAALHDSPLQSPRCLPSQFHRRVAIRAKHSLRTCNATTRA